MKKIMLLLFLTFSPLSAFGSADVTVVNNNNFTIAVAFTASGCAHVRFGHIDSCSGVLIEPGQSASYHFKGITSSRKIHMGMYIQERGHYSVASGGGATTTGTCQIPAHNQFTYTSSNMKYSAQYIFLDYDNYWQVNIDCNIEKSHDPSDSLKDTHKNKEPSKKQKD